MKIQYVEKKFRAKSMETIEQANEIITEYQGHGLDLTLRQLYYQFVARDLIPNTQNSYKALGNTIKDARMAGLIDWWAIVDRTRGLRGMTHWESPESIISATARSYREDKWADQDVRVEAWIEKEALIGVISNVCNEYDIDHFACKGYVSASATWNAAQRLRNYNNEGQKVVVLHLGDHDPEGWDITRCIGDQLRTFGADVEIKRLALNTDQVERYDPPPNPVKLTSSRASGYIQEYGTSVWELDALDPLVISDLIGNAIRDERDEATWRESCRKEDEQKESLREVHNRWDEVVSFLND